MSAPEFPWPHRSRLPVRFRDVDAYGHVNNAVFATYLEQARCDCYMELTGRQDPSDVENGLDFVVARTEIDHVAPILAGDCVEVAVFPERVGNSSFTLGYEMRTERAGLVSRARTVCVAYDHRSKSSRPLEPALAARLRAGLVGEDAT